MKKLLNKKGFTLMEMLIVVAIIVILVAISVPTFTKQLNSAKAAADEANLRAAKASATSLFLTDDTIAYDGTSKTATYNYDAESGQLILKDSTEDQIKGYGKSTTAISGASNVPNDNIIQVVIKDDGTMTYSWVAPTFTITP